MSPYSWHVPGGVNDHIASLAGELETLGHEPWIIAPNGSLLSHPPRAMPERFISAGSAVPFVSNGSRAYVNVCPLMPLRMRGILRRADFDLIHLHEPCVPTVTGSSLLVGAMPIVGTFHAAGSRSPLYRAFAPAARYAIGRLSVRIAVSETAREFVAQDFPGEYRVIPNGVRIVDYAPARGVTKTPGRILFVGRAEPRKGLEVLLRAFDSVRAHRSDSSLVLVGPDWAQARSAAPGLDVRNIRPVPRVAAMGRTGRDDKVREMGEAEVLCVPSLNGESFGLVLTEGMAAGLPIVASDLPSYRAVLQDGALGRLVPAGDSDALADALIRLLDDAALRARLRERGIQAVERYSWQTVVTQVLQAYEDALAAPAGLRPLVDGGPGVRRRVGPIPAVSPSTPIPQSACCEDSGAPTVHTEVTR